MITLTELEKTGSIGKVFIPLEIQLRSLLIKKEIRSQGTKNTKLKEHQILKATFKKNARNKKKRFQDVATKPTKDKLK